MPSDGILSSWGTEVVLDAAINLVAAGIAFDVLVHLEIERKFGIVVDQGTSSGSSGHSGVNVDGRSDIGLVRR